MELFRDVQIDWLGKKWYFLGFSLIFSIAGLLSIFFWHGIPLGVDFKGGTLVYVKFDATPSTDRIRQAVDGAGIHGSRIQAFGPASNDQIIVSLPEKQTQEANLEAGRTTIVKALQDHYSAAGATSAGKVDLDNVGRATLTDFLVEKDPEHLVSGNTGSEAAQAKYAQQAGAILDYRDKQHGGLVSNMTLQSFDDGQVTWDYDNAAPADAATVCSCTKLGEYRLAKWGGGTDARAYLESGTFLKLRELTVSYDVPTQYVRSIPGFTARSMKVNLAGRNLFINSKYNGFDPEVNNGGNVVARFVDLAPWPPSRSVFFSVDVGF